MASASDDAIRHYAAGVGAVIVTKDEDFAVRRLLADGPSVVWLRVGNTRRAVLLDRVESELGADHRSARTRRNPRRAHLSNRPSSDVVRKGGLALDTIFRSGRNLTILQARDPPEASNPHERTGGPPYRPHESSPRSSTPRTSPSLSATQNLSELVNA